MAMYRHKPVTFEAKQFWCYTKPWPAGVIRRWPSKAGNQEAIVFTQENGDTLLQDADWIITYANGDRAVCKPDVFEATYELVEGERDGNNI